MDEATPAAREDRRELRTLPFRAVVVVCVVEAVAIALVVATAAVPPVQTVLLAGFLVLLSVVHTELATGVERTRRRTSHTSYFDLSSVWTFAAAVSLPPTLTAAVVCCVYLHLWHRVWRPADVPLHRHVYTTATVLIAATAANAVVRSAGGLPQGLDDAARVAAIVGAVLLYVGVNTLLVAVAIALTSDHGGVRRLLGRWDDNALEAATVCMGALTAVAVDASPGLVVLVLPPVLVLHRAVLVRQLEEVASTDSKTGLLNAAAWQEQAARTVARVHRAGSRAAVLLLDLDHFKTVNDAHGHLAGDDVLAAVAGELRAGVREHDLVGRFGGEEFVVLLGNLPAGKMGRAELSDVAERIRGRIAALDVTVDTPEGALTITGLSISIGGAQVPADYTGLEQVMKVADASLYAAKRDGRNLVRIA